MIPDSTKASKAVVGAAIVGGLAVSTELGASMIYHSLETGGPVAMSAALWFVFASAFVTIPAFLIGLMLIGAPLWAAFERLQIRSRAAAILAGVLLAPSAFVLITLPLQGPEGPAWDMSVMMILPGALAGWTLHRVAYGMRSAKP
jgi:hypothetical protein